jgi:hypothetical protein
MYLNIRPASLHTWGLRPSGGHVMKISFKKRVGSIQHGLGSVNLIVGVAIGLAVLAVISTLTILATGSSAGIVSAISQINAFLSLIGLGVAVGLLTILFGGGRRR